MVSSWLADKHCITGITSLTPHGLSSPKDKPRLISITEQRKHVKFSLSPRIRTGKTGFIQLSVNEVNHKTNLDSRAVN